MFFSKRIAFHTKPFIWEKNKKNIVNLSSAESAGRVIKDKESEYTCRFYIIFITKKTFDLPFAFLLKEDLL